MDLIDVKDYNVKLSQKEIDIIISALDYYVDWLYGVEPLDRINKARVLSNFFEKIIKG